MNALAITIGLSLLLAPGVASAQQSAPGQAAAPAAGQAPQAQPQDEGWRNPMRACRGDLSSLCKDVSGLSARLQCLKSNQDKLSPDCLSGIRAVLGLVQTKAAAAAALPDAPRPLKACRQELASLCPDIAQGEGGRIRCLRDNRTKVGPSCAQALDAARDQVRGIRQACEADRARLCADAGVNQGDQLRCLRERQADLTGACREAVIAAKGVAGKVKAAGKAEAAPLKAAPAATPEQTGTVAPLTGTLPPETPRR